MSFRAAIVISKVPIHSKRLFGSNDHSVYFLWGVLVLALVRGVIYAVLNPPFGSPDELDHFQYIQHLATSGASGPRGAEGHQPVPYYALMVPVYWLTADHSPAIQDLAIRLASLPFLLGTVLFTWLAACKLAPNKPVVAVVATAFVALHPQLAYIAASINNDNAANFMGAVLTYLMVSLIMKPTIWKLPAIILAISIALMAKGQILPAVAISAMVVVVYVARSGVVGKAQGILLCLAIGFVTSAILFRTSAMVKFLVISQGALSLLLQLIHTIEQQWLQGSMVFRLSIYQLPGSLLGELTHPSHFGTVSRHS